MSLQLFKIYKIKLPFIRDTGMIGRRYLCSMKRATFTKASTRAFRKSGSELWPEKTTLGRLGNLKQFGLAQKRKSYRTWAYHHASGSTQNSDD